MNKQEMERQTKLLYTAITEALAKELPAKAPKLVFTKARTFWGGIQRRTINGVIIYRNIRISSYSFHQEFKDRPEEFLPKVTETICHELAHMTHWHHKQTHAQLTLDYLKQVEEVVAGLDLTEEPIGIYASVAHSAKVTLADITTDSRKARAALRTAGIERPGAGWEWFGEVPTEVQDIVRGC